MDEKLIKDDRKENIKMFQGMEKQFLYSKYSGELNQIFGDKCFNNFYTNLLSARKKNKNKISNIETYSSDSKYKNNALPNGKFDIKSYKHFIKDLKKELELEEKKRKEYKENLKLIKKIKDIDNNNKTTLIFKKKKKRPEVPSIGWYHPNYNSIRKNERTINIGNGYNQYEKLDNENKIYSPRNESNRRNSQKILKIFNKRNRNLSEDKIKSLILDDTNNKSNNNITSYLSSRNNALKFSQYSPRKPLITESLTSNIISNTHTINSFSTENLKGLIEFKKMSSNFDSPSFIPKQTSVPPIGFYKPKYEIIQKKSPDIFLSRNHIITKQMKLKKLLYEYNVPKEYELITNLNVN